jgi:hypothetical protein
VTVLTLGLFILVINGLMFWVVAQLVGGFHVAGFWSAVGGALLYSVCPGPVDAVAEIGIESMSTHNFSIEFFPPKTAEGAQKLRATRARLALAPKYSR